MKFALVGYDKDNDVYDVLEVHEELEYLKLKGKEVAELQKETDSFRANGNGEPFDWFEIVDANDTDYPDVYYWSSVENRNNSNNILLKKRFTEAAIKYLDELDFYHDLLDEGITIEDVANAMGSDAAAVMQKFCEEHGLI